MPSSAKQILAVDLGAESGRLIAGAWSGESISLDVVHRFPNRPVRVLERLYWDVLDLHREILQGLRIAAGRLTGIASVGVDTWGVDFGLVGEHGTLLGHPRHYRDPHTENILAEVDAKLPLDRIYAATGIQFMRFNSLFQLAAMRRDGNPLLGQAKNLLFMPDLFHYFLSGEMANELTNASTSQMLDPKTRHWRSDIVRELGIPDGMLGKLVPPGTVLGPLRASVAQETGLGSIPVVAPATHDTAAAVAAVPVDPSRAAGGKWAYISSGTWSLLGLETRTPRLDGAAR
ncbi:MAG: rhamnulokinase family protein, partial [Planctomycetota bacterium]